MGHDRSREYARLLLALLWVWVSILGPATPVAAFEPQPVPGRLLLTLQEQVTPREFLQDRGPLPHTGDAALDALNQRVAAVRLAALFPAAWNDVAKSESAVDLSRFLTLDFAADLDLETVRAAYEALDVVEKAELDWMQPLHRETNDFSAQWHLESRTGRDAHITGGWNHSIGDTSVVLAIADSGVDWMHPDLGGTEPGFIDGNIWINWDEYGGTPGVDDDDNGLVDDIRGWDFVQNLGSDAWPGEDAALQDNDPRDFNGHGTHVAGIAGAQTNNATGVAGVGYRCKIMPLRIGGSIEDRDGIEQGVVYMSYAATAILYAAQEGATAINCSWGSSFVSVLAVAVDLAVARGIAVVVSAGNDNHQIPSYLGARGDCIDVAATTRSDTKAPFSNFGSWVDVAAPGVEIYSTYYDHTTEQHGYRSLQGTSMAAPIVTGLVGLVKARYPFLQGAEIKAAIQEGADDLQGSDPAHAALLGAGRVNGLKVFGDRFLNVPGDYPSMVKALAASSVGDTVAVRGDTLLTTPLYVALSGRVLLGGWDRGFGHRDLTLPTVITSHGRGPCLEFAAGVDSTLIVDGFRFTGGAARFLTTPSGYYGGGVLCSGASPLLRNCEFDGNVAGDDLEFGGGGGGFFANSRARLTRCRFVGNQATQGAGLYGFNASLRLEECLIDANSLHQTTGLRGAGVYLEGGSFGVQSGRISRNGHAAEGGALFARGATVELQATHIERNSARTGAGLALLEGTALSMHGCTVSGNLATHLGGGIFALGSVAEIVNVTFHGNAGAVGGLFAQNAPAPWSLHNDLFVGHENLALFFFGTQADLDFNLYWDNPGGHMQGLDPGPHALVADPLFVNAAAYDFALGLHSPALDSGDPAIDDADGSRSDRGAFGGPQGESRAPGFPQLQAARHIDASTSVAWSANAEPDLFAYALYRGTDSSFVPTASNHVGSVAADRTAFADPEGHPGHWYRLAAVDSSGASSGFSAAVPAVHYDLPLSLAETLGTRDRLPSQPFPGGTVSPLFALHRSWPNPCNPRARISFELPSSAPVRLEILDVRGRGVRTLLNEVRSAGTFALDWDGRDDSGRDVATGVYVVSLRAGGASATLKLTLLR